MAAITRFILNYKDKHPYNDSVPIDYRIAMVLLPTIVLGSSMGIYLHQVLPEIVCSILLVLLLFFTAAKSWFKGKKMFKEESAQKRSVSNETDGIVKNE